MLGGSAIGYKQGMRIGAQAATNPLLMLEMLVFLVIDSAALTVLVFLRKRFGERSFTPIHYLVASALISGFAFSSFLGSEMLNRLKSSGSDAMVATVASVYAFLFMLVGGAHLAEIFWRGRKDDWSVLSTSYGEPYLMRFGLSYWVTTIVVEPLLILAFAKFLGHVVGSPSSGTYFTVLALLAAFSSLHQYRMERDNMVDANDARLLALHREAQLAEVESGKRPSYRAGGVFRASLFPRNLDYSRDMLRDMVQQSRGTPAPALPEAKPAE